MQNEIQFLLSKSDESKIIYIESDKENKLKGHTNGYIMVSPTQRDS